MKKTSLLILLTTSAVFAQNKKIEKSRQHAAALTQQLNTAVGQTDAGKKYLDLQKQARKILLQLRAQYEPQLAAIDSQIELARESVQNKVQPLEKKLNDLAKNPEKNKAQMKNIQDKINSLYNSAQVGGKTLKQLQDEKESILAKIVIPQDLAEKIANGLKNMRNELKTNPNLKNLQEKAHAALTK